MNTMFIPIHSLVDVITNSSSVIYTTATNQAAEIMKLVINEILKMAGSEETADSLFVFNKFYRFDLEGDKNPALENILNTMAVYARQKKISTITLKLSDGTDYTIPDMTTLLAAVDYKAIEKSIPSGVSWTERYEMRDAPLKKWIKDHPEIYEKLENSIKYLFENSSKLGLSYALENITEWLEITPRKEGHTLSFDIFTKLSEMFDSYEVSS